MKVLRESARAAARRIWLARNEHSFVDQGQQRKPQLLVDVSVIIRHDAATGIQRVVRSIWSHLSALRSDQFDVIPVYAGQTHGYCYGDPDFLRHRRRPANRTPVSVRAGDVFLGLDLAAHFLPHYERQLDQWRAAGVRTHMVVYDLLPLLRPDWFEPSTRVNFATWFDTLSRIADQILCISDHVSGDVERFLAAKEGGALPTIGRLFLSGDIAGSVPSRGISARVQEALATARRTPTILMVGTVEPRKGYDAALPAFEHLWNQRGADAPSLVIVGKPGWKTGALQEALAAHPENGKSLHWLDRASDEELCLLYDACAGVFMASRGEGFGLPVIEAAMHRKPVLARDLPVFRELGLPAIIYFDDDQADVLSARILDLLQLARGPVADVKLPSWSECVAALLPIIGLPPVTERNFRSVPRTKPASIRPERRPIGIKDALLPKLGLPT